MTDPQPTSRFWHPLGFWKVVWIFAMAQIVSHLAIAALREGLGLAVPMWIAGGLGGIGGVLGVQSMVRRRRGTSAE